METNAMDRVPEPESWRRRCGCLRTSDKLKHILNCFPGPPPPTPDNKNNNNHNNNLGTTCISAYCTNVHQTRMGMPNSCMDSLHDYDVSDEKALKKQSNEKSWRVVGEVVQLIQLSVTATALALYYLIYCYMQVIYYTLRSALYFHNADGSIIVLGLLCMHPAYSVLPHPRLDSAESTEQSTESTLPGDLHEGSGEDPTGPPANKNETREALKSDGSEQDPVVFLSDKNSYIPVSIKPRSPVDSSWREPPAWEREYRRHRTNGSRVQYIEAECQDDFMKIRVGFNGSFSGLVYSAGYSYDPDCMYINGSGRDYYEFYIQLNRCGTLGRNGQHEDTRKHPAKNLMWNTITVQYNPLIEEELDEHFKVTCEYGYDFWKTVTFPFLDVEVATGNPVVFTLQPPECYMEIRSGYGATGARVTGPVRVGDPLTLLIYMRSSYDGFDIVVNDCFAHNGAAKRIQLIDEYGCPVDDKLISRFRGSWSESGVFETQVYAYMKTFRFTGSPALYIECDVRMCHGRCPSQPCHWRNMKNVKKRSVEAETASVAPRLSENISLFQSLRVLQEGEEDEDMARAAAEGQTCMKTSALSAMIVSCSVLVAALLVALLVAARGWRQSEKRTPIHAYVPHKGRIK
ncbi:unnamed protein product [Danaus chrysippus]|uniref:(African queen) hypothetical protein n=1 Tax=Danaus chrysippus TaxID=151541 RepID=A0A8J2R5T8_9NEOP|nr:unnamed protein product [Danaus chrysippus]